MTARSNNISVCFTKLYWLENNMKNNFLNAIFANTHTLSTYIMQVLLTLERECRRKSEFFNLRGLILS